MRYRLRTLFFVVLAVAIGLAWWLDRANQLSRLDLQKREIRHIQIQLNMERIGAPILSICRFKTQEEAIASLKSCKTERDIDKLGFAGFKESAIADEMIGPLGEFVADSTTDDKVRQFAVFLLGEIGHKKKPPKVDPIPLLITVLDDPSSTVRRQAMMALGHYGSLAYSALPRLHELMKQNDMDAFSATLAVKAIDPSEEINPRLRELFFSDQIGVKANAAQAIAEHLPPAEAREFLEFQFKSIADQTMRDNIAAAISKIKE